MKLFCYWEGPRPWYIQECLDTVRRTCTGGVEFHMLTPGNIWDYIPRGIFAAGFQQLEQPAHRADCYRAALMALHGGFYYDADTIGLRSPQEVASDHDLIYAVWKNPPRRALNGYLYCRPGSYLAAQWLDGVNRNLGVSYVHRPWTALGEGVLTPLLAKHSDNIREVPRTTFLPLDVDADAGMFFQDYQPSDFIRPESVCFGLNNSYMKHQRPREMAVPRDEMRNSNLLIHRLFSEYL